MKGNQSTNWLYSFAFVKALYSIMSYYSCFYQSFVYFSTCYLIFTKFCEHNKHNSDVSMIEHLTLKNRKRTWSLCRAHVVLPSSPTTKGQHWLQDHSEPATCQTQKLSALLSYTLKHYFSIGWFCWVFTRSSSAVKVPLPFGSKPSSLSFCPI